MLFASLFQRLRERADEKERACLTAPRCVPGIVEAVEEREDESWEDDPATGERTLVKTSWFRPRTRYRAEGKEYVTTPRGGNEWNDCHFCHYQAGDRVIVRWHEGNPERYDIVRKLRKNGALAREMERGGL